MSDAENENPDLEKNPESTTPEVPAGTEPTTPLVPPYAPPATPVTPPADEPAVPPAYGQVYGQGFGQPASEQPVPPAYPSPAYPSTEYQPAYQPGYQQTELSHPATDRSRLPGWTWPVLCVLALVLGLVGGLIGASMKSNDGTKVGSAGVLSVQQRTAVPLPADNNSIAAVAAKVLPSTVQIIAEYNGKAQGATGSGWVFDKQGHVITNNHVVAQAASDNGPIDVIDQSGRHMKATVVGRSAVYDIAVLEVTGAESLQPAAIGSAQQMRVGETVVAFGSPLGLSATVTSGIISALDRPVTTGDGSDSSYINALQTDAAINPGNSGGPLVNLQGQVIGVDSAIASLGSSSPNGESGNIGVGFAIPIEQVLVTADQILRTGKALYPVIGASVRGTAALDGAIVESITRGSPASKSDLKVGDKIVKVDGKPVTGSSDVVVAVRSHQPGEKITLTVLRGGKTLEIKVGLEAKVG